METATAIVKELFSSPLKKDSGYNPPSESGDFWRKLTADLLDFEEKPEAVHATIRSLGLQDAESIIKKLPGIYHSFIEELAEQEVLGNRSEVSENFLRNKNALFQEQLSFFTELKNAATRLERLRMIEEMPAAYAAVSEELPEEMLQAVIKKRAREDLRAKFSTWDKEMEEISSSGAPESIASGESDSEEREVPVRELSDQKSGSFSYSWLPAIAAVLLIGFFIWQPTQRSGSEIFSSYAGNPDILTEINFRELVETEEAVATRGGEVQLQGYSQAETEQASQAISFFQRGEFHNAKRILQELDPQERNEKLLFFLAVSRLNSGEITQGIQELEFLHGLGGFFYAADVKFHLALGYLQQGNRDKARELLRELQEGEGKYREQAEKILKEMRWF